MVKILLYNRRGRLVDTLSRTKFPSKVEVRSLDGESKIVYKFWKFLNGSYEKAAFKEVA